MTCRFPDACMKAPDRNRNRKEMCRSCAQVIAAKHRPKSLPRLCRPNPKRQAALDALPEERHAEFTRLVDVKDFTIAEAKRIIEDDIATVARRAAGRAA